MTNLWIYNNEQLLQVIITYQGAKPTWLFDRPGLKKHYGFARFRYFFFYFFFNIYTLKTYWGPVSSRPACHSSPSFHENEINKLKKRNRAFLTRRFYNDKTGFLTHYFMKTEVWLFLLILVSNLSLTIRFYAFVIRL